MCLADDAGVPKSPEMPAHGRTAEADGVGEVACAQRAVTQQIHHPPPARIGQRDQRTIEGGEGNEAFC
jgi:hypothetical protein